jgi:hypothetical protein
MESGCGVLPSLLPEAAGGSGKALEGLGECWPTLDSLAALSARLEVPRLSRLARNWGRGRFPYILNFSF